MAYRAVARLIEITADNRFCWALYEILGKVLRKARKSRFASKRAALIAQYDETPRSADTPQASLPLTENRLVYDVGMNNGDDVEYYLSKGLKVVGIEANPDLCHACEIRFANEIAAGRLKVINCAVGAVEGNADFFIDLSNHVRSTLLPPRPDRRQTTWKTVPVQVKKLSSLIEENGEPLFIKIDVEHSDAMVLHTLLDARIIPSFISAESHVIEVFCVLVAMGYREFKFVPGSTVHVDFRNHRICTVDGGSKRFCFKHHSSGPFGEDIPGPWVGPDEALDQLLAYGLGWIDIHARR